MTAGEHTPPETWRGLAVPGRRSRRREGPLVVPPRTAGTQTTLTQGEQVRLLLGLGKGWGASDWEGPGGGAAGGLVTWYFLTIQEGLDGWASSFTKTEPSALSGSAYLRDVGRGSISV